MARKVASKEEHNDGSREKVFPGCEVGMKQKHKKC